MKEMIPMKYGGEEHWIVNRDYMGKKSVMGVQ